MVANPSDPNWRCGAHEDMIEFRALAKERLGSISTTVAAIDSKLDSLVLSNARQNGITLGHKQSSWWTHPVFIAAITAVFLTVASIVIPRLIGAR